MVQLNTIITESLSPAVAISGIGLLIFGLNNRVMFIGSRVRELNRELRDSPPGSQRENVRLQIELFMKRAYLVRNAIFLLFGGLAMMVFTAVAIALSRLGYLHWDIVPAASFLSGLVMMLVAVIIEAYETTVNMKTLRLDVDRSIGPHAGEPPPSPVSGMH